MREGEDAKAPVAGDGAMGVDACPPIHTHIGVKLRRMFEEVVHEPIPDRLRALLEKLEDSPATKPEADPDKPR